MRENGAKHKSRVALILIDVINHFEFPDGPSLLRNAMQIAPRIVALKLRARKAGIPSIYVNDNFGQWRSDATKLVQHCVRPGAPSRKFVEILQPDPEDYLVLKPMHSAFYQTPLDALLRHLGVSSLILGGIATNSCILCTVHDANMRDYELCLLSDCSAARSRREHQRAIEHIGGISNIKIRTSRSFSLEKLKQAKNRSLTAP